MSTQVVSFRASGEFLTWLQSQVQEGESLNQAASRLLKHLMDGGQQTLYTPTSTPSTDLSTVSTESATDVYTVDATHIPGLQNLIVSVVEARTQAIAERMEVLEQRLGEYERLRDSGDDALRSADRDLAKAVAMKCQVDSELQQAREEIQSIRDERDELDRQNDELLLAAANLENERSRLDERVSDLLLQVENLRDELNECRQQQSAAANECVQNHPPLSEVRDRVLNGLKVGKQSAAYKAIRAALNQFVKELACSTPNGIKGNETGYKSAVKALDLL